MRNILKIPTGVQVLNCNKRKVIFVKGILGEKLLKLPLKTFIDKNHGTIVVTNKPFRKLSNKTKKSLKSLQGTSVSLLKKSFLDVSIISYKKLKLIGVGYKAFFIETSSLKLIHFKLGLSHNIFFKVPDKVDVRCHKSDKIFISSNYSNLVTQIAAFIRNLKKPEPYKGKGISYVNEIIELKEGKKV